MRRAEPLPGEPVGPFGLPASFNTVYEAEKRSAQNRQQGMTKRNLWARKAYTPGE
jgi:hypothetical protein